MGRPLQKRYFGDPAGAGFQITVTAWVPGESGPEEGFILRQRSNLKYLVEADGEVGVCKLVNKSTPEEGEMVIEVDTGGDAEYARIINNRVVKTWQGNTYAWPATAETRSRPEADIEGS